jgi:alkylation response protein AidB-like acyl-CoA dehydrogenase
MVADAITQLDAARALVYMAAKAVDTHAPNARHLVSEAKKFATDAAWEVANKAMQIMVVEPLRNSAYFKFILLVILLIAYGCS